MGAVEHLKTLCCLGLKPESAMIAVTPLLHEVIPHGWTGISLLAPDATIKRAYTENPEAPALYRERAWTFVNEPSTRMSIWISGFRAKSIGWGLALQGRDYLESRYYREIEAPLDSCWTLGGFVGDGGKSSAFVNLTRPRSARPFTVDDVQRLDPLRPWLAHAFRRSTSAGVRQRDEVPISQAGPKVLSGQLIVTSEARLIHRTAGLEHLLIILTGEPLNPTRYVPACDTLPAPILKLLRQIAGAANGTSNAPPRMRISTAYGVLTLEAKWLVPAGTLAADAARDPKSCLISVTIELHEHPIAHAARALRESGATPAQTKVGIQLALGKPKPVIADELGIQLSSVMATTKKLYQTLDVHNSAELGSKIWLHQKQDAARQILRRAG